MTTSPRKSTRPVDRKRKKKIAIAVLSGLAIACLAWGFSGSKPQKATAEEAKTALKEENLDDLLKLPAEERKKKLTAYGQALSADMPRMEPGQRPPRPGAGGPGGPGGPGGEMRQIMDKLSPEDREAFRRGFEANMRKHFMAEMSKKVDAFFKATPEEQEKLLDDEVARFKEREEERKKDDANGDKDRRGPPQNESKEKREEHMRNFLDSTSSENRAQMQEYFSRVRAKMEASKN